MRRRLWAAWVLVVVAAGATVGLVQFALRTQATATLFVYGESKWSKGRADAVTDLIRYAADGDEADFVRAMEGLNVPLSDLRGRRALEADPPDVEAAVAAWVDGGHTEADARALATFYLRFEALPLFAPSLAAWRATDDLVLELARLADVLYAEHVSGAPDAATLRRARARVIEVSDRIRPMEATFSRRLADAVGGLRDVLLVVTAVAFATTVGVAAAVIAWAYRAVRARDEALRRTFEQATVGMAHLDRQGRLASVNAAFERLADRPREALLGVPLRELLHEEDRPEAPVPDLASGSGTPVREWRLVLPDGRAPWVRTTVSAVRGRGAGDAYAFATFEDVSEARRLHDELRFRARHDMLTGLVNRYEFDRCVTAAIAGARRTGRTHAVAFLDLDQFKVVNDTSGHAAGDALLAQWASTLVAELREVDLVARMGGDEFALLLEDTDLTGAISVADKVRRRAAREEFAWGGKAYRITASVGVTDVSGADEGPSAVLRRADVACYLAKEAGRDRVHAYAVGDEASTERHGEMEWVGRIRSAVREERMEPFAQRIAPLAADGTGLRYELLIRLRDEEGRLHPPGVFLGAAERYGTIAELDRWLIEHALATLEAHPAHLDRLEAVHLNVSAASVSDPVFAGDLAAMLDGTRVPADRVCIEITETAAMRDLARTRTLLSALRDRGVQVALDDFGSGLSSFAYLKTLPVDLVKIDGLLVRDVASDRLDRTLVRSVHQLASVLGKRTVAEFVEDDAIRGVLREIGVDFAQGFGVHRPEPWRDLLARDG